MRCREYSKDIKDIAFVDTTRELFIADGENKRITLCSEAGGFLHQITHPYYIALAAYSLYVTNNSYTVSALLKFNRTNYQFICSTHVTTTMWILALTNSNIYVTALTTSLSAAHTSPRRVDLLLFLLIAISM